MLPITPNHMLLGRSSPESPPLEYSDCDKFSRRLAYIAEVEQEWWRRWISSVLPTILPAGKWKRERQNLVVGDVVMLTYPGNFKDDYILARVTQVHPDAKGLVRRATVKFRRKNIKEPRNVCKAKMVEEIVAVQRLALLEPAPRPSPAKSSSASRPVTRSMARVSPSPTAPSNSVETPPGVTTARASSALLC